MTKVKLAQIVNQDFLRSYQKLLKLELPMKAAYKLKKMANVISEEQTRYDELRKELLLNLGEKDDKGELKVDQGMVILGQNEEKYKQEHKALLEVDVEISPIKIDELGEVQLTGADLLLLDGIVTD